MENEIGEGGVVGYVTPGVTAVKPKAQPDTREEEAGDEVVIPDDLSQVSDDELIELAESKGIDLGKDGLTREEIIAALQEDEGEDEEDEEDEEQRRRRQDDEDEEQRRRRQQDDEEDERRRREEERRRKEPDESTAFKILIDPEQVVAVMAFLEQQRTAYKLIAPS